MQLTSFFSWLFQTFSKISKRVWKILIYCSFSIASIYGHLFFRFYTDLFASIGIFLIFYYLINNKRIDYFFILSGLILMNFRIALIPVFFIYSFLKLYKDIKVISLLYACNLIIFSLISLIPVLDFGMKFAQINSTISLFNKMIFNFIFTFGFKSHLWVYLDKIFGWRSS